MPNIRPTFSESWYRVAGLKAKLRPAAQISRQYYRGERWYIVRDPAGNQYHRLSDAAYRFVALLDGTRSVGEAWELAGGQMADDAPTQPEVIQILSQLHAANLLEADVTADSVVLLRRHKHRQNQQTKQRLMSTLFPRIPIWDPDTFLQTWLPALRPLLSGWGAALWVGVVVTAVLMLLPRWADLHAATMSTIDLRNHPENVFYFWAVFVIIKLIHELGHGFACRRFGGEVHEVGIMFLVFVPVPYVDASSSWSFQSKWARIFVSTAGMIAELFVAALLVFVWIYSRNEFLSQVAFNGMLIASVSTILFNANPLLRFDGYYILSDWLEIPNLRQKANEYTLGLFKRHIFRLKLPQPLPPPMQRVWSVLYAVAAAVYRVFIGIMICMAVIWKVPILGILMAIGVAVTFLILPLFKLVKYLAVEPELHRKRGRAVGFCASVAAGVLLLIGGLNFNIYVYGEGALEPRQRQDLHARADGFVREIHADDGQLLQEGDIILIAENEQLDAEIFRLEQQIVAVQAAIREFLATDDVQRQIHENQFHAMQRQLDSLQAEREDLTIRAPFTGRLIAPGIADKAGEYLYKGEPVATVATLDEMIVKAIVDQRDYQLAVENPDPHPQIRLAGLVSQVLRGRDTQVIHAAQIDLPSLAVAQPAGGPVAIDPENPERARTPQHQIHVILDNPAGAYMAGQRAYVRWEVDRQSLMWNWSRRFWQLVRTHSDDRWL